MELALQTTYYNQEIFPVRSDAQPNLRELLFTLGPLGIGIYQNETKLDIFSWMEIWNIGWINKTLWFRIVRDNEKSKHKYHFDDLKTCEHVWKTFRDYFHFHIHDRKIDSKLLFGRTPPKVNRIHLLNEQSTPSQRNMAVKPKISRENISELVQDRNPAKGNLLHKEHYGAGLESTSIYNSDDSLKGNGERTKEKLIKAFSAPVKQTTEQLKVKRGNSESLTSAF